MHNNNEEYNILYELRIHVVPIIIAGVTSTPFIVGVTSTLTIVGFTSTPFIAGITCKLSIMGDTSPTFTAVMYMWNLWYTFQTNSHFTTYFLNTLDDQSCWLYMHTYVRIFQWSAWLFSLGKARRYGNCCVTLSHLWSLSLGIRMTFRVCIIITESIYLYVVVILSKGWFQVCAQPMRDGVTL